MESASGMIASRETARSQVRQIFRALLSREPDPGADQITESLERGDLTLEDVISQVVRSSEYLHPPSRPAHNFMADHSQFGELAMLLKLWVNGHARHRVLVDVGTRGRPRSNAYDLLKDFGWRGILFEANPHLIDSIRDDFSGLDFELVECAVSDHEGEASFHLGVNDDVSSLDPHTAQTWGPLSGCVVVECRRLPTCLEERSVPIDFDLLSIDIEGEDIKVMNDLIRHSPYRPRWVVIEASNDFRTRSLEDLPFDPAVISDYELVGQTSANLILRYVGTLIE